MRNHIELTTKYESEMERIKIKNKALRRKYTREIDKLVKQHAERLKENERLKRELLKAQGDYKQLEAMKLEKEKARQASRDLVTKDLERATTGDRGKPGTVEIGEKAWDSIFSDSPLDIPNNKSSKDKYKNVNYRWKRLK